MSNFKVLQLLESNGDHMMDWTARRKNTNRHFL